MNLKETLEKLDRQEVRDRLQRTGQLLEDVKQLRRMELPFCDDLVKDLSIGGAQAKMFYAGVICIIAMMNEKEAK